MIRLNALHLIGTDKLRPYLHGYYIDYKHYEKLRMMLTIEDDDTEQTVNSKKIKEIEQMRESAIIPMKIRPTINADYASYLSTAKKKKVH